MRSPAIPIPLILTASVFTFGAVALGYHLLGWLPALLFGFGFVGGWVLWICVPSVPLYHKVRLPFFVTLILFAAHKFEERHYGFFPALSEITGVPVPDASSPLTKALYLFAGAWLLIPVLLRIRHPLGGYLAWTFFTSMGVTEVAHFVFPFIAPSPFGYFPGVVTALFLVPCAWWGLTRLWQNERRDCDPALR